MMKILFMIILLSTIIFGQVDSVMQAQGAVKVQSYTAAVLGDTIQYINYDRVAQFNLNSKTVMYGCRAYNKQGVLLFEYPKTIQNDNLWTAISSWQQAITAQKNRALLNVSMKGNGVGINLTEIDYE
jgi:hypothetical protein